MQAGDTLRLRDIHAATAPPWWPPAPGWWVIAAAVLLLAGGVLLWRARRTRRRRAVARLFDDALARAATPSLQVAAMSELLRRAARRSHPQHAQAEGEDWLRLLDQGLPAPVFAGGAGALLRDGAYRPDPPRADVDALAVHARARFLSWMGAA